MTDLNEPARDRIEAAAFRRLLTHLRHRTDAQNVVLMGEAGFCRNCLADWLDEAAAAQGRLLGKEAAREWVYGMPYADYKARHQTEATSKQLARMAASVERNKIETALDESVTICDPPSQTRPT